MTMSHILSQLSSFMVHWNCNGRKSKHLQFVSVCLTCCPMLWLPCHWVLCLHSKEQRALLSSSFHSKGHFTAIYHIDYYRVWMWCTVRSYDTRSIVILTESGTMWLFERQYVDVVCITMPNVMCDNLEHGEWGANEPSAVSWPLPLDHSSSHPIHHSEC